MVLTRDNISLWADIHTLYEELNVQRARLGAAQSPVPASRVNSTIFDSDPNNLIDEIVALRDNTYVAQSNLDLTKMKKVRKGEIISHPSVEQIKAIEQQIKDSVCAHNTSDFSGNYGYNQSYFSSRFAYDSSWFFGNNSYNQTHFPSNNGYDGAWFPSRNSYNQSNFTSRNSYNSTNYSFGRSGNSGHISFRSSGAMYG